MKFYHGGNWFICRNIIEMACRIVLLWTFIMVLAWHSHLNCGIWSKTIINKGKIIFFENVPWFFCRNYSFCMVSIVYMNYLQWNCGKLSSNDLLWKFATVFCIVSNHSLTVIFGNKTIVKQGQKKFDLMTYQIDLAWIIAWTFPPK